MKLGRLKERPGQLTQNRSETINLQVLMATLCAELNILILSLKLTGFKR